MGQQLVGVCCSTTVENEQQVLSHVTFGGDIFASVEGIPSLPSKTNISLAKLHCDPAEEKLPHTLVKEVTDNVIGVPHCGGGDCCRPDRSERVLPPDPPDNPMAVTPHFGEAYCRSPHFCNSPRSSKESEWNSSALLLELNTRARRLSLEFVPIESPSKTPARPSPRFYVM